MLEQKIQIGPGMQSCYKAQQKPPLLRARCIEDTIRGEPDALLV